MLRNLDMIYLSFGTFDLTKADLVNLEKLILDNITLTDHSDHYVGLGKSREGLYRQSVFTLALAIFPTNRVSTIGRRCV